MALSPLKLANKGLIIAHVNICSIRNQVYDLNNLVLANSIHIFAVSDTHLDSSIQNSELLVNGFSFFRRDRNKHGGGVAIFVQSHLPVKERSDFMLNDVALWFQVHLHHLKPVLVSWCYRPPDANADYMK